MPHRAHLFSLRPCHAFIEACIDERYTPARFVADLLAGITVGIIAIPLAMALAIATGVAPQYGLYTAIIAGFVIALTGGSRFSISGPTAAFVVILYPIVTHIGFAGLLVASLLAGIMLIIMAVFRLGRLIEYIPESVTLGFTGGIAIVIATLQVKDLFGLSVAAMPEHYVDKVLVLAKALPGLSVPNTVVGVMTLAVMLLWPRLKTRLPPHLPAVLVGTAVALWFAKQGMAADTIGSRFSYSLTDGSTGHGIPPILRHFMLPWQQTGADGVAMHWDWPTLHTLLPAAFSIAMLGAIESLLCAVVLDGMSGKRHSANSELLGQGIANVITPFFGGITATAAIARSAANFRAGAQSPAAAMIHALVVLAGLLLLAPWLAYLPMASMAALLVIVAWNMSEAHKIVKLLRTAPRGDIAVLMTCLLLTVFFDMVIAITCGILLAALLFVRDIANLTRLDEVKADALPDGLSVPTGWKIYRINGPLFFAAADKIFSELYSKTEDCRGVIVQMDAVALLDGGGLATLEGFVIKSASHNCRVVLCDVQAQPRETLAHAHLHEMPGHLQITANLKEAVAAI